MSKSSKYQASPAACPPTRYRSSMLDVVSQWVAHYGYVLVAIFLFIEALGVPIPGETALVTAAALAGQGTLSVAGVMLAAFAGTVSGGYAGYWIGLRGGRVLLTRHG